VELLQPLCRHTDQHQKMTLMWNYEVYLSYTVLVFMFLCCNSESTTFGTVEAYGNVILCLQCGTMDQGLYVNLTERNLQDAQKFFLMHEVVQPVIPIPYFMEDNSRFSHVVVDVVQCKDMLFHIIYLATGMNFVLL